MWYLLDRFGRPSLSRHLQLRALELNQQALRLLNRDARPICGPDRAGELMAVAIAVDACWWAMRGTLADAPEEPRWPTVKAGLDVQARLLRPLQPLAEALPDEDLRRRIDDDAWPLPAQRRRKLQGTLLDQSRWLGVLVQRPAPPQAVLEAQVVRIYRRARRDLRKRPYRRRARRRLRRLLALVELTGDGAGPTEQNRLATMARAGRRLHRMLVEHGRLSERIAAARSRRRIRTMQQRQRDIAQVIKYEVARHFAERPGKFADRLSWEIFCRLSDQPESRYGASMPTVRARPMVDFGAGRRLNADPSDAAGSIDGVRSGLARLHADA